MFSVRTSAKPEVGVMGHGTEGLMDAVLVLRPLTLPDEASSECLRPQGDMTVTVLGFQGQHYVVQKQAPSPLLARCGPRRPHTLKPHHSHALLLPQRHSPTRHQLTPSHAALWSVHPLTLSALYTDSLSLQISQARLLSLKNDRHHLRLLHRRRIRL